MGGSCYASDAVYVWGDWNQDQTFQDDATEKVTLTGSCPTRTGTIGVPAGATLGATRLRIRLNDTSAGSNSTPCGHSTYGQVEDYTVIIQDPPAIGACCNGTACAPDMTQAACESGGGIYQGNGSTCTPNPCKGACCLPIGGCDDTGNAAYCAGLGGTYRGNGTTCATAACPNPGDTCELPLQLGLPPSTWPLVDHNFTCGRGAHYTNTCLGFYDGGENIIYALDVTTAVDVLITLDPNGTTYTGILLDSSCPPNASTCIAMSTNSCGTPHSLPCTHLEPGVYTIMISTWPSPDCIPYFTLTIADCGQPVACCFGDGGCQMLTAPACTIAGGTPGGLGTTCTPSNPCPQNDTCSGALPLAVPGTALFDNTLASDDPNLPTCITSAPKHGVS